MNCDPCAQALARLVLQIGHLREEVSKLRAELRRFGVGQAGGEDAALVEAAHAGLGDRAFLGVELAGRALRPDAIGSRLAGLLAGRSVRSIGKSLARAANRRTDSGLVLRRIGASSAGVVWHIQSIKLTNSLSGCTPAQRRIDNA